MPDRLEGRATWLINLAQQRSHALLVDAFTAAGSRPYYYRLLVALEQTGPVSQAEVGRLAGIDRSDVTAALSVLDGAGFTRRRPDPSDRRKNVVALTAAGRRELDRLDAVLDGVQVRLLEPLDARESRQLIGLVARVAAGEPTAAPRR